MMYCEKCGQEIEEQLICPKCGCLSGYREPKPQAAPKPVDPAQKFRTAMYILCAVGIVFSAVGVIRGIRISLYAILSLLTNLGALAGFVLLLRNKTKPTVVLPIVSIPRHVFALIDAIFIFVSGQAVHYAHSMWTSPTCQILAIAASVLLIAAILKKKQPLLIAAAAAMLLAYLLGGTFKGIVELFTSPFAWFVAAFILYLKYQETKAQDAAEI